MKRTLALLLSVTILFSLCSQSVIFASGPEASVGIFKTAVGPAVICESKECFTGETISVDVELSNNPGIMYLELTPEYSEGLTLVKVENGEIISNFTKGLQYVWAGNEDVTQDGRLMTFTFEISKDLTPGDYSVDFIFRAAYNYDEELVSFSVTPAKISVKPYIALAGIAFAESEISVFSGDETVTLNPIFTPPDATNQTVAWDSSDTTVATVSDGVVTLLKNGTVTITVTSDEGKYSANCIINISCSHKNTHDIPAEKSTCIKHGHDAYTFCSDCNTVISGSAAELPFAAHTGGEATCKDKAVCSVCGVSYGSKDATNHVGETEVRDAKAATCCEDGYTGDTYCVSCGVMISEGEDIPATKNHVDVDGKWETDGTSHWHTCYFGTKFDKSAHTGGTATCKGKAVCSVCGVSYGSKNATNHTGETEVRDEKAATCCEDGYTGDTYCVSCGVMISEGEDIPATKNHVDVDDKWETDGTSHWHTCYFGTKFDVASHTGGTATCKDKAVCSVCGVSYGSKDATNHTGETEVRDAKAATCCEDGYTGDTYCVSCGEKIATGSAINATGAHEDTDGEWETDGTSHWHTCYFGTKFDVASHTGGTATCKALAVCSVCGMEYGELDADNHAGETELRGATDTYSGDTYCTSCGELLEKGEDLYTVGDANNDGKVDTADATKILRFILKESDVNEAAANCDGNDKVDTADATRILRYILKEATLATK